jgi:hypothetical protein
MVNIQYKETKQYFEGLSYLICLEKLLMIKLEYLLVTK